MKLTLRQAHKIVEKIVARMATIDVSPIRQVNVWEAEALTFDRLLKEFQDAYARNLVLASARQAVRDAIGVANTVKVDGLVSKRKALLDQLGALRSVVSQATTSLTGITSAAALAQKVEAAKAASKTTNSAYSTDTVTIQLLNTVDLAILQKKIDVLQLQVEEVEDQLTTANAVAGAVTISDDVAAILREEGVIA